MRFDQLLPHIHRYDGLVFIFHHIFDFSLEHLDNFNKAWHKAFLREREFQNDKKLFFFPMRDKYYEIQKIRLVSSKFIPRRSISSEMIKFTAKILFNYIVNEHCSVCKILPSRNTKRGQWRMQSWTQKYIVKSSKCFFLWNKQSSDLFKT